MKKYFLYLLLALLVIMSGCESKIPNNTEPQVPAPSTAVCVLKLKKPEYKNLILAGKYPEDNYLLAMRGYQCEEPIGKTGVSPYWELADNWLLVDWNWPGFPYDDTHAIVLTGQTWDKFKWEGQENMPTWPLTEPYIEKAVEKMLYVPIDKLESYGNASYDAEMKTLFDKVKRSFNEDEICLAPMADKMDSIWAVLQTDLSTAIQNGDLEKL